MKLKHFFQTATTSGVFLLTAAVSPASSITYTTNTPNTGFTPTFNNTLTSSSGEAATLTYIDNGGSTTGVPSNIDFGNFVLTCPMCSTQLLNMGAFFNAFTFDLIVVDQTDGASGIFVGTSTGGQVFSDVSQITVDWSPTTLGPGTSNVLSGNFGTTEFVITNISRIVAPNSGDIPGETTVQGNVLAGSDTPEPATCVLLGSALVGLGLLKRKNIVKR